MALHSLLIPITLLKLYIPKLLCVYWHTGKMKVHQLQTLQEEFVLDCSKSCYFMLVVEPFVMGSLLRLNVSANWTKEVRISDIFDYEAV